MLIASHQYYKQALEPKLGQACAIGPSTLHPEQQEGMYNIMSIEIVHLVFTRFLLRKLLTKKILNNIIYKMYGNTYLLEI